MIEHRHITAPIETRAAKTGPCTAHGYAALYDTRSQDLGGYVETIAPGAFTATLAERNDVIATYNHDVARILGRTSSGTLRVKEDKRGLHYQLTLPNTTDGRDVAELMARGDITGSSFSFRAIEVEWDQTESGYPLRRILEAHLAEVGPVIMPAYKDADAALA